MPDLVVVDYRYPGRLPLGDEDVAPRLTDAFLSLLSDCSGDAWRVARYAVDRSLPPRRGEPTDGQTLCLHDVLLAHDLYGAGWSLLWGGGTFGGFECYAGTPGEGLWLWGHVSTSNVEVARITRPLFVLVGNTERGLAEIAHSFTHLVERVWDRLDPAGFAAYVGRGDDPMDSYRTTDYAAPVQVYAGGHGNCHVPPGRDHQYDYAGYEGGQEGFLRRWLGALPRTVWDALEG